MHQRLKEVYILYQIFEHYFVLKKTVLPSRNRKLSYNKFLTAFCKVQKSIREHPANLKMAKIATLENGISLHKIYFHMMSPKQQIVFLTIIGKTFFYFYVLYPI